MGDPGHQRALSPAQWSGQVARTPQAVEGSQGADPHTGPLPPIARLPTSPHCFPEALQSGNY